MCLSTRFSLSIDYKQLYVYNLNTILGNSDIKFNVNNGTELKFRTISSAPFYTF